MAPQDWAGQHYHQKLVEIGEPAVPHLKKALKHSVPRVRYWSIAALGKIGDEQAIPALIRALQDDSTMVRAAATYHLIHWWDREEVQQLIVGKLHSRNPKVQEAACRVIAEKKHKDALPVVMELMKSDYPSERRNALIALEGTKGDNAIESLIDRLKNDRSGSVRLRALELLAQWANREDVQNGILKALDDEKEDVQDLACSIVVKHNLQKALPELKKLAQDKNPTHRYHALNTLVKLQGPKTLARLKKALREDESPRVRSLAADYLGDWLNRDDVVPLLISALGDESKLVQEMAYKRVVENANWNDSEELRKTVLENLVAENARLQGWCLRIVREKGYKKAIPRLNKLIDSKRSVARYGALRALARLQGEKTIPLLKEALLKDPSSDVRGMAVYELGRWFEERDDVKKRIFAALDDKDRAVQGWAMHIIAQKDYKKALPKLLSLLKNSPNKDVRHNALRAIVQLQKSGKALANLKTTYENDPSPVVREGALRSVTLLEPPIPESGALLIEGLRDTDKKVRAAAAALLRRGFGQHFEYQADATIGERERAIERWQKWYGKHKNNLKWNKKERVFVQT